MARNIVHSGGDDDILEYSNAGSAISAGDVVVMGNTLGVALVDIPQNGKGNVAIGGIVGPVPKVSGAVFAVGEKLLWDSSAGAFDDSAATPGAGDIMGAAIAARAGGNGETTCYVKLTPGNTTVS